MSVTLTRLWCSCFGFLRCSSFACTGRRHFPEGGSRKVVKLLPDLGSRGRRHIACGIRKGKGNRLDGTCRMRGGLKRGREEGEWNREAGSGESSLGKDGSSDWGTHVRVLVKLFRKIHWYIFFKWNYFSSPGRFLGTIFLPQFQKLIFYLYAALLYPI